MRFGSSDYMPSLGDRMVDRDGDGAVVTDTDTEHGWIKARYDFGPQTGWVSPSSFRPESHIPAREESKR